MTDQELERRLAGAVSRAAPDDFGDVLSRLDSRKGTVIPLPTAKKKKETALRGAVAACLALILAGGGGGLYYHQAHAVASVVSLDVNPSIELKVNRSEKVLSCAALNEDAAKVLFNMDGGADLVGTKLDVAVNAIVGALVRAGYLDSISSAILISVEDRDQARAEKLQEELRSTVDQALGQGSNTQVLSQVLTQDADPYAPALEDDTQAFQDKYAGVSKGKMSLVMKVMEMNGSNQTNSTTALDQLCALSVEELIDLLEYGIMEIPIGKSAACWNAQEYAGTLVLSSVVAGENDVDPEFDGPRPHYEVELHTHFGDFDYLVDAFTGEVYSGQKDVLFQPTPDADLGVIGGADGSTAIITAPPALPAAPARPDPTVTEAQAKAAAFAHAGCAEGDVSYCTAGLDYDDGVPECWKVEFCWQGDEYEYEISCGDCSVLDWDREACDSHQSCRSAGSHHGTGHHHG